MGMARYGGPLPLHASALWRDVARGIHGGLSLLLHKH
jgi:hypothetical protein